MTIQPFIQKTVLTDFGTSGDCWSITGDTKTKMKSSRDALIITGNLGLYVDETMRDSGKKPIENCKFSVEIPLMALAVGFENGLDTVVLMWIVTNNLSLESSSTGRISFGDGQVILVNEVAP